MPTLTGKENQPKVDESPELPAVPVKIASDQVQKMSDTMDVSTEKAKEMSEEESDKTMDVSTEKAKTMSDVEEDSTKKAKELSEEESDKTMDASTEKAKKMSDVKDKSTKEGQEVLDANEDSSEKAQKTPDAGDDLPEEAQKMSGEESEAADESTEDATLNTLTNLDFRMLLIPFGKNKDGELYFWQPSYPKWAPPPQNPASGSLKWHQKAELGNTLLLDAYLELSDDFSFLHAVVDESESTEESPRKRVVWRKPTSELIDTDCPKEGKMVWQASTSLTHSADLKFQASDLEERRRVLLVPFNPDDARGREAPGSEEEPLSGNQSPQSAAASSEAETSDDIYAGSSPKKPRLD